MYRYNNADGSRMCDYLGGWDEARYPARAAEARFLQNHAGADITALPGPGSALEGGKAASAALYAAWDGPYLYLCAEVRKSGVVYGDGAYAGPKEQTPPVPDDRDCVCFGVDIFGERGVFDSDGRDVLCVTAGGEAAWYRDPLIPSLSAAYDSGHPEYCRRLARCDARAIYDERGAAVGFRAAVALQIGDLEPENGTVVLVEAEVHALTEAGTEILFWSHRQEALYTCLDHAHPVSADWGEVTLTGRPKGAPGAYSDWRLRRKLKYLASPAHQKGVWTPETQAALDAAAADGGALLQEALPNRKAVEAAARRLETAIRNLRWADTRFPDPCELPERITLPNPFRFLDGREVTSLADWEERKREILALAQFYEYGFMPAPPDTLEAERERHMEAGDEETVSFGPWKWTHRYTGPADKLALRMTASGRQGCLGCTVYLPEPGRTGGRPAPVLLSYDGDVPACRERGIAVVHLEAATAGDIRALDYAWGTRTGCFYDLYPYARNGKEALAETGSEMAAAWAAARVIDALERLCAPGGLYEGVLDPKKLAVTGFSIHGKYAFAAAVFDARIGVCIPGASGATGLSPWRYVYAGQVHDWTDTPFRSGGAAAQTTVAFGTETLGNALRHNPVRCRALMRRFFTQGRAYARRPGAYGYGLRLPFDQSCLAATLAGRALVLVNTPNDYNDGSVSDALTLEVVKPVYRALGYDAEALVKFNFRNVCDTGDPHGVDDAQTKRTAAFLAFHYLGQEMEEADARRLNTDPFALPVCNGRTESAYDYYWGGYNAITGGTAAYDGWYYRLPELATGGNADERI